MKRDRRTIAVRIIQIVAAIIAFTLTFLLAGEPKIVWACLAALGAVIVVWLTSGFIFGMGSFFSGIAETQEDYNRANRQALGE